MVCLDDLPWLGRSCKYCALPLGFADSGACAGCESANSRSPAIDLCIAALSYEFPVDRLVTGLKYRQQLPCARILGELLAIRLLEETSRPGYQLPDVIVPVPLHPRRLLQRSFNQSAELARWVAAELHLPQSVQLIRRTRDTPGQAGLSRTARLQNMHKAFSLTAPVKGARVALLDDVITTSATVTALAQLCKRGGAQEVQVWAAARTIR